MFLNKRQKITTVVFSGLLLAVILFATPYWRYNDDGDFYGDLFLIETHRILFTKLFFEIGLITVFYLLALLVLKSNSKN